MPAPLLAKEPGIIRIVVVDDHELYRRGLETMLALEGDFHVVGEAATALDGVRQVFLSNPDVVLLDLRMPGESGIDACTAIKANGSYTKVLMLTASDDGDDLLEALKAGADGYLEKTLPAEELAAAIRRAHAGEAIVPSEMMAHLLDQFTRLAAGRVEPPLSKPRLSKREMQVLGLIGQGKTNREIAGTLVVSENTVKNHARNILSKLGVASRVEAALYAVRENLVPRDPESP